MDTAFGCVSSGHDPLGTTQRIVLERRHEFGQGAFDTLDGQRDTDQPSGAH